MKAEFGGVMLTLADCQVGELLAADLTGGWVWQLVGVAISECDFLLSLLRLSTLPP